MRALETLAIYVTPFFVIGIAVKLLMKRRGVDLSDVQAQAGSTAEGGRCFSWALGAKKNKAAST